VLRTCCEHVANVVTCNIQHQESFSPPPMLRLYYKHVATSVVCNIQHQELSSLCSSTQTQHHTSATSKLNIRNICQITVKH
jgi:hypothetical protein